ncbi:MAG: hypothetical protein SGILL_009150 [Bacillariaceae sp.]
MEDLLLVGENITFSETSTERSMPPNAFLDLSELVLGAVVGAGSDLILFGIGPFPVQVLSDQYSIQLHATAVDRRSMPSYGLVTAEGCDNPTSECVDSTRMIEFSDILGSVFMAEDEDGTFPEDSKQYEALKWLSEEDNAAIPTNEEETTIIVQRYVLALVYLSTGGTRWRLSNGWMLNDSVCNWFGVTCGWTEPEADYVYELSLANNFLKGTIPSHLGAVQSLQNIDMSQNSVGGTVPTQLFGLPSLEEFNLKNNDLIGTVPSFHNALNLYSLDLSANFLTGTIAPLVSPESLSLNTLDLSSNQLIGSIPESVYSLAFLNWLVLSSNAITGTLSQQLGRCTNLIELDLSFTDIRGTIPTEIGQLTGLRYLSIVLSASDAGLSGTIPVEFANLSDLWELSLGGHQFTAASLDQFVPFRSLDRLSITGSGFTSTIPSEIGMLTNLYSLSLEENMLAGAIPSELGMLAILDVLDLHQNELTGAIPTEIGLLSELSFMDLRCNNLTGQVPTTLSRVEDPNVVCFEEGNNFALPFPEVLSGIDCDVFRGCE